MKIEELIDLQSVQLQSINLTTLSSKGDNSGQLQFYDEYETKIENNHLIVLYYRNLGCEPEELFSLEVTFSIIFEILHESKNEIEKALKVLKEDDLSFLLNKAACEASLLIGQITRTMGLSPIITPPFYAPLNQ